ncbi:unnamed protein product, partial [Amoebophrya sp. A25]
YRERSAGYAHSTGLDTEGGRATGPGGISPMYALTDVPHDNDNDGSAVQKHPVSEMSSRNKRHMSSLSGCATLVREDSAADVRSPKEKRADQDHYRAALAQQIAVRDHVNYDEAARMMNPVWSPERKYDVWLRDRTANRTNVGLHEWEQDTKHTNYLASWAQKQDRPQSSGSHGDEAKVFCATAGETTVNLWLEFPKVEYVCGFCRPQSETCSFIRQRQARKAARSSCWEPG